LTDKIKPIETQYKGYRFRSRLEARWAVFFDEAGIKWEYEPEGFELPSGKRYLPDFRVHNVYDTRSDIAYDSMWIEVKGHMTQDDMNRIKEFVNFDDNKFFTAENPTLIVGNIPDGTNIAELMYDMQFRMDNEETCHEFNFETIDGDYFGLALMVEDGGKLIMCGCDSNYDWGYNPEFTLNAYIRARQARFEHGECG
jgi:hypothetical protein